MYSRYPPNSIPSLLDMAPVDRPENATTRMHGREEGIPHDAETRHQVHQVHHHQGAPLLDNPERSSLRGDSEFRHPLLSASGSSFKERNSEHHFASQPRGQLAPHHSVLQDPSGKMYRERERHLDFSSGKMVLIDDDNRHASPAPHYQPNLMSREPNRSLDLERQNRDRQRKADLQRRAELQRELEMERENLRRQKEAEESELEHQRKRDLERQRDADRQRELELQREIARERQIELQRERNEREREREREQQRLAEEDRERKRQLGQEHERLRLQLEREQREREIQRQQEIILEREIKIQQNYEENARRKQQELDRIREIEILRDRERGAVKEQEMVYSDPRMPSKQIIPSLLTMPKVSPSSNMKKGLLGDIHDGMDDALMEKVRLQQAMIAQQSPGSQAQKPNQNPKQNQNQNRQGGRNKRGQRKRGNQQQRDSYRKGSNSGQNQRQNKTKNNSNKKRVGKPSPGPKTPPWLKEGAFDASKSKKDSSKADLYDPLHPTEDDETVKDDGGLKRKHSDGELQVRIHRDNEDRDVLDPPQKKQCESKLEIPRDGDIHPTKEMLYQMKPKMLATLEWKCHVCNVKCLEVMNYHQHMMGKRHQTMMSHIMEVAEAKTAEALKTFRAESHVDRIRRGFDSFESHQPSASKKIQQTYFCDVCTTYIFCNHEEHDKSKEHENALKVTEKRCTVCDKTFKSMSELLSHCNTINHKMSFEVHQEKDKKDAAIAAEQLKRGNTRGKVYVTVDEVGFDPDDADKAVKKSDLKDGHPPGSKSSQDTVDSKASALSTVPDSPIPSGPKGPASLAGLVPTPTGDLPLASSENVLEDMKRDPEPWSMQDLVKYNPNSIVGQEYVIPVTGFFCKLCRKFYNSENSARVIHCKSQAHFTSLKKLYEEMQMAAQMSMSKEPKQEAEQKVPKQEKEEEQAEIKIDASKDENEPTTEEKEQEDEDVQVIKSEPKEDPLSSVQDPLPSVQDPLPSVQDPVPSVQDPVPSVQDPLPSVQDPLPKEDAVEDISMEL